MSPNIHEGVEWGSVAQWVSVVVTFAAVLVALFKEELIKLWWRPKLTVRTVSRHPDWIKEKWRYPNPNIHSNQSISNISSNQSILNAPSSYLDTERYMFRIWVENNGKARAEKVQVFAKRLERLSAAGQEFAPVKEFLPMYLVWSNTQMASNNARCQVILPGLSPKMGHYCDLGHIINPYSSFLPDEEQLDPNMFRFPKSFPSMPSDKESEINNHSRSTVFFLELEYLHLSKSHLLPPATYKLGLLIAAANCSPVSKTLEIKVTGAWHDDQEQMFRKGAFITIT